MSAPSIDHLLECKICYNPHTTSGAHAPYLLSCGHTFCLSCLSSILSNGNITCPNDRSMTQVRGELHQSLNKNWAFCELIDTHAQEQKQQQQHQQQKQKEQQPVKQSSEAQCWVCQELKLNHTQSATVYCKQCQAHLCDQHNAEEHSSTLSRNHTRIPASQHIAIPMCTAHPVLPLHLYCTPCQMLVCATCALAGKHKGHDMMEPEAAVAQVQQEMANLMTSAQTQLEHITCTRVAITQAMAQVQQTNGAVITQIQASYAKTRAELDAREREHLSRVTTSDKSLLLDLSSHDAQLARHQSMLQDALSCATVSVSCETPMSILLHSSAIRTSLQAPVDGVSGLLVKPATWNETKQELILGNISWEENKQQALQQQNSGDEEKKQGMTDHKMKKLEMLIAGMTDHKMKKLEMLIAGAELAIRSYSDDPDRSQQLQEKLAEWEKQLLELQENI